MRTPILLAVIVALGAATAGPAMAGERGWRQHHAWSHERPKLHARHHGEHLRHAGRAWSRFAHGRSWQRDGHRHFGFKKFRPRHVWKHRRHHDHRPAFGLAHGRSQFVIARDRFGHSVKIIIGSRHGHFPKRRHRFR